MDSGLSEGLEILEKRQSLLDKMLKVSLFFVVVQLIFEIAELAEYYDTEAEIATAMDWIYIGSSLGYAVVIFSTMVVFGMWIHRATKNIVQADVPGFNHSPGWAVGWYFVPIANLFKPFQIMRQIWNVSHGHWVELDRGNNLLTLWWTLWIITNIATNVSFRLYMRAKTADDLFSAQILAIVSSAGDLVLYPVAILMVAAITKAQLSSKLIVPQA